ARAAVGDPPRGVAASPPASPRRRRMRRHSSPRHTRCSRAPAMTRALGWTIGALLFALGSSAHAYTLKKSAPTGAAVRWHRPKVELQVMDTGAAGISRAQLASALGRAAAAWNALPTTPSL